MNPLFEVNPNDKDKYIRELSNIIGERDSEIFSLKEQMKYQAKVIEELRKELKDK